MTCILQLTSSAFGLTCSVRILPVVLYCHFSNWWSVILGLDNHVSNLKTKKKCSSVVPLVTEGELVCTVDRYWNKGLFFQVLRTEHSKQAPKMQTPPWQCKTTATFTCTCNTKNLQRVKPWDTDCFWILWLVTVCCSWIYGIVEALQTSEERKVVSILFSVSVTLRASLSFHKSIHPMAMVTQIPPSRVQ